MGEGWGNLRKIFLFSLKKTGSKYLLNRLLTPVSEILIVLFVVKLKPSLDVPV